MNAAFPLSFCMLFWCHSLLVPYICQAASFDCGKAATPTEKLVCSDQALSELDTKLGVYFKTALQSTLNKENLRQEQRAWLGRIKACQDVGCLLLAYEIRIKELAQQVPSAPNEPQQLNQAQPAGTEQRPTDSADNSPAQPPSVPTQQPNPEAVVEKQQSLPMRRIDTIFTGIANGQDGKTLSISTKAGQFNVFRSGPLSLEDDKNLRDALSRIQNGTGCKVFLATIDGAEGVFGIESANSEYLGILKSDDLAKPRSIISSTGCPDVKKWVSADSNNSQEYFYKTFLFDNQNIVSIATEPYVQSMSQAHLISNGKEYVPFMVNQKYPRLRLGVAEFSPRKLPRVERNFIRNDQGQCTAVFVNMTLKDLEILNGILSLGEVPVGIVCSFSDLLSPFSAQPDVRYSCPVADFVCITRTPQIDSLLTLFRQDRGGWNGLRWGMTPLESKASTKIPEIGEVASLQNFEYDYPPKVIPGIPYTKGQTVIDGVKVDCDFYAGALMRCSINVQNTPREEIASVIMSKYSGIEHKIFVPSNEKEVNKGIEDIKNNPILLGEFRVKAREMNIRVEDYIELLRKSMTKPDHYIYYYTGNIDSTSVTYDAQKATVSYMDMLSVDMMKKNSSSKNTANDVKKPPI